MELKLSNAILFFTFIGLILLYFLLLPLQTKHKRYMLYFVNARSGKIGTEARYVLKSGTKSCEAQFVEELVLGAMNHDFYDYFKKGTTYNSCFVDGETLYVSFPAAVLNDIQEKMPFEKFYALFKKNIFANFSNIKELCMFLDGVQVYGEENTKSDS